MQSAASQADPITSETHGEQTKTPTQTTAADLGPDPNEHLLELADGRRLAYAENGSPSSRAVVIFFSGLFSIGTASTEHEFVKRAGVHYIAPTPTGMGRTSPRPSGVPYHVNLINDMNALLAATHPDGIDALYLGGGSYGTAMAQMLYGAPYDAFPYGRHVQGMVLMAGFSPFKYHADYAQTLAWHSYISVGPPSRLPFRALQHVFRFITGSKLRTVEGAVDFLRQAFFDKMDDDERDSMQRWLSGQSKTEHEFILGMAENNVRSVALTWDGFMEVSDVLHSDWGFDPRTLDADHAKPVLVCGGDKDDMGGATNLWLVENYENATLFTVPGGHISGLFHIEEIWDRLDQLVKEHPKSRPSTA